MAAAWSTVLKRILRLHNDLAKKVSTIDVGFGGRNDSLCVVDKIWPRILCHSLKKEVDSISLTLKFGQSYDLL